jgi:hypothetical protein
MNTRDIQNRDIRFAAIGRIGRGKGAKYTGALAAAWLALGVHAAPAAQPPEFVNGKPVVHVRISAAQSSDTVKHLWDDNPETIWQTPWRRTSDFPHDVLIDLGAPYTVTRLGYLRAGKHSDTRGVVKDFEMYAGPDPKPAGAPVARGVFTQVASWQYVDLAAPVRACYVVLRCLSSQKADDFVTSIAELRVVVPEAVLVRPGDKFMPPERIPPTELGGQYEDLLHHLRQDEKTRARRAGETFNPAALIAATDRDPADIVAPLKRLTPNVGFPEGEELCNPYRCYGQA